MSAYLDYINTDIAASIIIYVDYKDLNRLIKYIPFKVALNDPYVLINKILINYPWFNIKFNNISKSFVIGSFRNNLLIYEKIIENISGIRTLYKNTSYMRYPRNAIKNIHDLLLLNSVNISRKILDEFNEPDKFNESSMFIQSHFTLEMGKNNLFNLYLDRNLHYSIKLSVGDVFNLLFRMNYS